MIRFVDLDTQLGFEWDPPQFAFFSTVTDKFEEFSGNQTWETIKDFREDFSGQFKPISKRNPKEFAAQLQRRIQLIDKEKFK